MLRNGRHLTVCVFGIVILSLAGLSSCSSDVAGPKLCSQNEDCEEGHTCHLGVCRLGCSGDSDCAGNEICVSGACLVPCSSDTACPDGEICLSGYCQPEPQQTDGGDGEDGGGDVCVDQDNDGYGTGCILGDDCNDLNNTVHPGAEELCDDNLDNNCDGNINENCACEPGSVQLCSSVGDPMSLAPPMRCTPGTQACVNGTWSPTCENEVGPVEETCNGIDDDCDGDVDEGVMDPLGGCNSTIPPEDCVTTTRICPAPANLATRGPSTPSAWASARAARGIA
ncbi:MAG: putative metal-binding motif-containing protein [Deltaproteobacteria bacterium]|nr:putative metal-binding motif-containing protein [Deltaproteobacteria bacterium]